jgi:preprotein translocase subunit SecB
MMPKTKDDIAPNLHPVQLTSLNILELYIKVNQPLESADLKIGEEDFTINIGHSNYDEKKHTIAIKMQLGMGTQEGQKSPFVMKVVLGGIFTVDETKFPKKHIEDWANRNAPIILYPYMREQVFALSVRAGFPGMILPLLTVPTIKVEVPKKTAKPKSQKN